MKPLRELKSRSLNLSQLAAEVTAALGSRGATVHTAASREQAIEILSSIIRPAERVTKTWSPILDELDISLELEKRGILVSCTNPGERLMRKSGRAPLHPRFPMGRPTPPDDPAGLRQVMLESDTCITGADAAIAESGTIMLVEEEGDARCASNMAFKHIAVIGVERVVRTLDDAALLARVVSRAAFGRALANYVSLISGPSSTGDIEFKLVHGMHGPGEMHAILLDNGRSRMVSDGLGELLFCVECGACLEPCPLGVKRGACPHPPYVWGTGSVRAVLSTGRLTHQLRETLEYCASCGACRPSCPAEIDIAALARHALNRYA